MSKENQILGNPEQGKQIESLLRQAGEDRKIKRIIEGKGEPWPISEGRTIIAYYDKTVHPRFPRGEGSLVGYHRGYSNDWERMFLSARNPSLGENDKIECPLPVSIDYLTYVTPEITVDGGRSSIEKAIDNGIIKSSSIVKLGFKDGCVMIGFFGGITNYGLSLYSYTTKKKDRIDTLYFDQLITDFSQIDSLTIMEPEKHIFQK